MKTKNTYYSKFTKAELGAMIDREESLKRTAVDNGFVWYTKCEQLSADLTALKSDLSRTRRSEQIVMASRKRWQDFYKQELDLRSKAIISTTWAQLWTKSKYVLEYCGWAGVWITLILGSVAVLIGFDLSFARAMGCP